MVGEKIPKKPESHGSKNSFHKSKYILVYGAWLDLLPLPFIWKLNSCPIFFFLSMRFTYLALFFDDNDDELISIKQMF